MWERYSIYKNICIGRAEVILTMNQKNALQRILCVCMRVLCFCKLPLLVLLRWLLIITVHDDVIDIIMCYYSRIWYKYTYISSHSNVVNVFQCAGALVVQKHLFFCRCYVHIVLCVNIKHIYLCFRYELNMNILWYLIYTEGERSPCHLFMNKSSLNRKCIMCTTRTETCIPEM